MSDLKALLSMKPKMWTDVATGQLTEAILAAISDGSVARVTVPDDDESVGFFTVLCRKIQERHGETILSIGRTRKHATGTVDWTFEGYSEKVKKAIAEARDRAVMGLPSDTGTGRPLTKHT